MSRRVPPPSRVHAKPIGSTALSTVLSEYTSIVLSRTSFDPPSQTSF